MAKNKSKKENKKILAKHTKANQTTEYYLTDSPSNTFAGRILVWLIVGGTVLLPLAGAIAAIIMSGK